MKRSNRLVILVGVLLAVLAFVGIVIFLGQEAPPPVAEEPVTTTVLVATQDIEIGDSVTPQVVETREVDPDAVEPTRLADPSQLRGQPALFRIPAGTQVTQEAIGMGLIGPGIISQQLEPGEKAIAFQVDRVQGLDFLIQPGDVIDIVVAIQLPPTLIPDDESVRTVKTVLQAKRVLYVSDTRLRPAEPTPAPDEEPGPEQPAPPPIENIVIVFAGTDQDAEVIRYAQRTDTDTGDTVQSSLAVTLRHLDDDAEEETTGITIVTLIADYGLLIPAAEDLPTFDEEPEEDTDQPEG